MSDQLPEGWTQASLAGLADARMGKTILAKELVPTGIPVYSAGRENEPWGHVATSDLVFDERTIVLSARGSIGFPKLPRHVPFVSTQTTIAMTTPSRRLAEWLRYWLETVDWTHETSGASIPMVTVRQLDAFTVPVAPNAEQERIVAKVETLLAQVRRAKDRLDRVPLILKRFRQAVLTAARSGRLTDSWREQREELSTGADVVRAARQEAVTRSGDAASVSGEAEIPATWTWASLGEITVNHDGRRVPVKSSDREKRKGPYPYYGASGVIDSIDGFLFDGEFLLIAEDGANLLSRSTPIAFTAKGRFWVNNHAHIVQAKAGIPLDYLRVFLNGIDLQEFVTGTAQPKLTQKALNGIPVPVPPLDEQAEIVHRVDGLFALATAIEQRVERAAARAGSLPQAILAKAFAGDLVPTEADLARAEGREYEDAERLLERFRRKKLPAPTTNGKRPAARSSSTSNT